MSGVRALAALLLVGLASCGARTELFVGGPDAGPRRDAEVDAAPPPPNVPCGLASGQTRTLVDGLDPTALTIDDAYVYWYDHATETLARVSKKGGQKEHLADDSHDVRFMAVDDTYLYWTSNAQLSRTRKSGGGSVELLAPTVYSGGVAVDASNVYFAGGGATVQQVAKTGGSTLTLADNQAQPMGVAVDDTYVYWVNGVSSEERGLLRVPIGGTGLQAIGDALNGSHVALDSGFVYWTDQAPIAPEVARVNKDGSMETIRVLGGQNASKPSGIGVDDTDIWWTDFVAGTVSMTPKAQGITRVVAAGQSLTRELAVDAACLYWTTETESATGGSVLAHGK